MMGLGFGALKQMSDSFKYNRELLKRKKKSIREIYKEEVKKRSEGSENQDLEFVRERVAKALRRNRLHDLSRRAISFLLILLAVAGTIWVFVGVNSDVTQRSRYEDLSKLFNVISYPYSENVEQRTEYYWSGPKAAETFLKNGLKHQNSESYYESGEQFRSALYYYDTLIREVYFYKSGEVILNFPASHDGKVHRITLRDKVRGRKIQFHFFDGKIVGGTYREMEIEGGALRIDVEEQTAPVCRVAG